MLRLLPRSSPALLAPALPLRVDGRALPGRVRRLRLEDWWGLLLRGAALPPGRSGLWLSLRGPLPLKSAAELVFLAGDGTVLQIAHSRPRWQLIRCRGARQVLVLRPGMSEQLGLRPGLGLDLLA